MQPWADLIARALKDIENRSWPTAFRGEFLIHAGKRFDWDGYFWLMNNWFKVGFPAAVGDVLDQMKPEKMDRGGIIGKVELIDCVREHPSPWKAEGQYGFVLRNAQPLRFVPMRGALMFFRVNDLVLVPA